MSNYKKLRDKYNNIIYRSYEIIDTIDRIQVKYTYILNEYLFTPSIFIEKRHITNKNINNSFLEYLFFNYGIANIINYYKLSCPKTITIEAGYINEEQISFFKKLIFNGLGEYFYRNKMELSYDEFTNFEIKSNKKFNFSIDDEFSSNLILVGGGKDSIVSLELLKEEEDNKCFLYERNIYPKDNASYNSIYKAGYNINDIIILKSEIDPLLLQLNKEGFLNGHVPVSSLIAFSSYIMAYLNNKKFIIASNEASSNEENIIGTKINHQYSKSIEFENDFRDYTSKYFTKSITYYSLLRPLLEIQIAKIFSKYTKYHDIFRSCNLSSKNNITNWCCKCPKCLFIFIILSPFIDINELNNIFKSSLLDELTLLDTFKQLLGYSEYKPFECVGTIDEVKYACTKTIEKLVKDNKPLPYLLKYYLDNYPLYEKELENSFNEFNNVPNKYIDKIKKELNYGE